MKRLLQNKKIFASKWVLFISISLILFSGCGKNPPIIQDDPFKQTNTFSSEVVVKWLDMKYQILQQPQEQNSGGFFPARFYSALGIALYESVVPGMRDYQSLSGQLQEMPAMPSISPGSNYHWPSSANAAMAHIFKTFLPNTTARSKASIDSLENALNTSYMTDADAATIQRSTEFGKAVAQLIFDWTKTDGHFTITAYIPPVGPGLWVPTPPTNTPAIGFRWSKLRPDMPGVLSSALPPEPIPYSTDPSSPFYISMKEMYDARQSVLTKPELAAQINYWRGTPGGSGFIVWYGILKKVLVEQGNAAMLDKAALAYCKLGIVHKDAATATYKAKYLYNELAPITYVRNVLRFTTWNSVFPTPASPAYPELHAPQYASSAAVLTHMFGNNYKVNTNGVNEFPGYMFNSFEEAAIHGSLSRFYAGVGTKAAVDAGIVIGKKTVEYMLNKIKFLK